MTALTVLISHERSGSHFLGGFFDELAGVKFIDEVCNPHAVPLGDVRSFHSYKLHGVCRDPEIVSDASTVKLYRLLQGYFAHLRTNFPFNLVVDIKYAHMVNFEQFWWAPGSMPFLLYFLRSEKINVLHLYRENTLEAVLSNKASLETGTWHSWQGAGATKKLFVDPDAIVAEAKSLISQIEWVRSTVNGFPQLLTLTYEQISRALYVDAGFEAELAGFVGTTLSDRMIERQFLKVSPPLFDRVKNFDQLARACQSAGIGHMCGLE